VGDLLQISCPGHNFELQEISASNFVDRSCLILELSEYLSAVQKNRSSALPNLLITALFYFTL